jgi:hypothetical protein
MSADGVFFLCPPCRTAIREGVGLQDRGEYANAQKTKKQRKGAHAKAKEP